MANKFQGYYDDMAASLSNGTDPTEIETSHYQTNHCMVGGVLTKNWNLPQSLIEPILYHHNPKFDMCSDQQTTKLSAILKLAEHIIANQTGNGGLDLLYNSEIRSEDKLNELLSFVDLNTDSYQELESISSDLMPVL
jgi:HD-like signal output (HDOD) protein